PRQPIKILPKNGNENAKAAIFYITILSDELDYYSIEPYIKSGGKVIPFPSKIEKDEENTEVTLYIYPANGYILQDISYKYKATGGEWKSIDRPENSDSNILTWKFDMPPAGEDTIKLNAVFQGGYEAMSVIDGNDGKKTTPHSTLKEAIESVKAGEQGIVSILQDEITLGGSISITGGKKITIVSNNWEPKTVSRGAETGSLFEINGGAALTLSGALGNLTIDGEDVNGTIGPLIAVSGGGTLSIINEPGSKTTGVTLKNNKTGGQTPDLLSYLSSIDPIDDVKAGVVVGNGGYFNMESGVINGNDIGVFTVDGIFEMNGGEIEGNLLIGARVNNDGIFEMRGGEIKDNPTIGVFVNDDGIFDMKDGVIKNNLAGGVWVNTYGVFNMNGGVIEGNRDIGVLPLEKSEPIGILAFGEFTMGGNARVDKNNFVYLYTFPAFPEKIIKIEPDNLPDLAAVIIIIPLPATLSGDVPVVLEHRDGGELKDKDVEKFKLLSTDMSIDCVDGKGVLAKFKAGLSIDGGAIKKYTSLEKAVSGAKEGVQNVISLLKPVEIGSPIPIDKNITLVTARPLDKGIIRKNGFEEHLFNVSSGGVLTLDGGGGGNPLVIDGSKYDATGALIEVSGNGKVTMNNGVTLRNNKHGAVNMTGGTFTMTGGEISENEASRGGGVYMNGGTFTMTGGVITKNKARTNGGAVYIIGGGIFRGAGEISGNEATDGGGGVYMTGGTFTLGSNGKISENTTDTSGGGVFMDGRTFMLNSNGEISGNTARTNGGGVFMQGNSVFTNQGGTIHDNEATNGRGGGVYYTEESSQVSPPPEKFKEYIMDNTAAEYQDLYPPYIPLVEPFW
ncbi:MAG: right-handed parallel beta-helix repeat-containing protein, partial [Spirochaetaceae bacterium]|nr:right-handed parallel beta-helix repeat-containing protein [Spirochaetaceae bacterium]